MQRLSRTFAYLLLSSLCIGCFSTVEDEPWDDYHNMVHTAAPRTIRIGGAATMLGNTQQAAYTPERFFQQVSNYLKSEYVGKAQRFVHLYPDVALEVLRSAGTYMTSWETLRFIGIAYDRMFAASNSGMHWKTLLRDRYDFPDRYFTYDRERKRAMTALTNGHFEDSYEIDLPSMLPSEMPNGLVAMDAWHIRGVLELLLERPDDAVIAFDNALSAASENQPYYAAYITLLKADALRRTGKVSEAHQAWSAAALLASQQLEGHHVVADPLLWEMLSYAKQVGEAWPQEVGIRFNKLSLGPWDMRDDAFFEATPDRLMLMWTARWRLERGEAQTALVTSRRAEAFALDSLQRDQAKLLQARALVAMGQSAPASSMLATLTENKMEESISAPAYALLGVLSIENGRTRHGLSLLRQALEDTAEYKWDGQAQAEADLGLAYLIMNEAETGLEWLHRAQQYFESTNNIDGLTQALRNEWEYLDHAGEDEMAEAIEARLDLLRAN